MSFIFDTIKPQRFSYIFAPQKSKYLDSYALTLINKIEILSFILATKQKNAFLIF